MYQPETEDLIPRCAPKPSTSGVNEAIVRPSVPEISILFSHPDSLQHNSTPPSATTSYAAWKKCLPQVIYPPTAEVSNAEYSAIASRSNVYPMRTAATVVPTINAAAAQFSLTRSEPLSINRRNLSASVHQTGNLESPMAHCNPTYTVAAPCYKMNSNSNQQRKSLDHAPHPPRYGIDANILTICAGTQTDLFPVNKSYELDVDHLATKADVAQMKVLLVEMHTEQCRLIKIVQQLLAKQGEKQNQETLHKLRDVATQCDAQPSIGPLPQKRPHIRYDSIEEEDSAEEDDSYRLQKKTNIAVESPTRNQQPQQFHAAIISRADIVSGLPKPATEQSMVMNELALKYLPNEKLSELLQELHVSPVSSVGQKTQKVYESPLKNIENYGKSSSDLSTASYKYLKKYRLLPEENNNVLPSSSARKSNEQENMLDLDTIRLQPKFM